MSLILWGLLALPLIIPLLFKYFLNWKITWAEWGLQSGIVGLVVALTWMVGSSMSHNDHEIINGSVISKDAWKFSCPTNTMNPCRNGYSCNCRPVPYDCSSTDSKGNRVQMTCYRTECDTCYVYPWEQNWYVHSNVKKSIEIDRVDKQGAQTPARWSEVQIGDPVSTTNQYKNWVKASSKSLFKQDPEADERFAKLIPEYPITLYDYYKVNRVLTPGFKLKNIKQWNQELSYNLGQIGPTKQNNTIIVMVRDVDRSYANAVRRSWYGFKKNDAVIFIGLDKQFNIAWAEVMSWSKSDLFNVQTRMYVEQMVGTNITQVDPKTFMSGYKTINVKYFVRRPMEEFEYLKGDITPPIWLIMLTTFFAVALSVGLSYAMHNYDVFYSLTYRHNPYQRIKF